jgi:hypothetical protein
MSNSRADSPALGPAGPIQAVPGRESPGKGWPAGPKPPSEGWPAGPKPSGEGWPFSRWLILIALVCAAHVALLYMFGARNQIVPRTATDAPTLKLADSLDEFLALNDPTLFALPHPGDFVTAMWSQAPVGKRPAFHWPESSRWLPLSTNELMTVFNRFMQTNQVAGFALQLKPPVRLSAPAQPLEPAFARVSTVRVAGDLTQRRLLTPMNLPPWPYADVIAPSKVQVLVNEAGGVVSAIVLPPNNSLEALSHHPDADQRALELARATRFAPAPRLTIGQMIFAWHTVPPPATNSPAASP